MKHILTILFLTISITLFSQEKKSDKKVDWNGYIQLRASSNFNDNSSVMLRRLKFWLKSTPDFSEHWHYKIQVFFSSWMQEKFFLQDVKITYKTGLFSFDMGQFTPNYSLQWKQPDYLIPSIERAIVVNTLHPDGGLGIRDLGIQANFITKNKLFETHIGIFNGYGIKEYRFDNKGYMLTNKSAINIELNRNKVKIGYSIQYRESENLKLPNIFPDTVLFSGKDFRYNFFVMYNSKYFDIQAEYLNADFDGQQTNGYYLLSSINLKKNQIVLGYEDYNDLKLSTQNNPHYRIGYNYLINKSKTKLLFDNYFQIINGKIDNYIASIQLQLFLK